ncbi:uncharacterized protein LOC143054695 [Mytilus galloprovincialis]|uniref:uncharacterized protein LOC143054695 n=1 Tax=Mytilus galloprovincialis TaxID=29158 RepID=UPI003F7C6B61
MAEEFTIEPIQVEDCNIFENQTVIVNDDGSLQIIGAPSDNVAKNSATSMFSGKIKKGGATSTSTATSDQTNRTDLIGMYQEQMINNQKLILEQQRAINALTKSVSEIKNACIQNKRAPVTASSTHARSKVNRSPSSVNTADSFYDSISEEESEGDFESSNEDEEGEPKSKQRKVEIAPTKFEKIKRVESVLSKKPKLGPSVHEEIAKIVNQGSESTVDHRSKEVQELLEKYVRPENCDYLEVPKVNKVLWTSKETDKRLKDSDRNFQRTQGYLVNGMIPLVLLMDKSLKSSTEESEENFELALDSLNMLLYAHRDMSSQRKRLLTPALDKKYYVLSNEGEKISSKYLFGEQEDLEKRMKEIDDSVKLGKKIGYTKGFGKDKTREPEKSNRDNNKSNGFNSGYSSGFKSSFLAKRAQINREGKKNKKGKGNLGHKKH